MRTIISTLAIAIALSNAALAAPPLEGSADFESVRKGAVTTKGKLHAHGMKIRSDTEARGFKTSMIMDTQNRKVWVIAGKNCLQHDLSGDPTRTSFLITEPGAKEERVGTETIDGHPTEKYKVTTSVGGKQRVHYVWRATDLKGFPIRAGDEAGTTQTRMKNIDLKKPNPSLFQPPKGCRAMPNIGELRRELEQMHGH